MFDDMRTGRQRGFPDFNQSSSTPQQTKPLWRRAAREIGICLALGGAIGGPGYVALDWWYHKDIGKPQQGGQVRMTEQNHIELVATPTRMTVYVTDHEGRATDLRDTIVTIGVGNGGFALKMAVDGKNRATLAGNFALEKDTQVVVKLDPNCQQPEMASFTPMTPEPPLPTNLICTTPPVRPATCRTPPSPGG